MRNAFYLLVLLFSLPRVMSVAGETNTYSAIWRRNIFALRTPPAVVESPRPAPPQTQVKLTGIAALPPEKWAILQIHEPGRPVTSVLLKEGDRFAAVEVLEINPSSGRVSILNSGAPTTLVFEKAAATVVMIGDATHAPLPETPLPGTGDP